MVNFVLNYHRGVIFCFSAPGRSVNEIIAIRMSAGTKTVRRKLRERLDEDERNKKEVHGGRIREKQEELRRMKYSRE